MIYLGSCSGKYYGLDANTGDVLWEYDTVQDGGAQSFHGDALVTADLVVVGSDGIDRGGIYAFERDTGVVRWRYDSGLGVTSDIVRAGQQVFAVTLKDDLICLHVASGELAWRFKSGWDLRDADRKQRQHHVAHLPGHAAGRLIGLRRRAAPPSAERSGL